MEVRLSPELQAKVERAAAENKSGAEEYVKQLVEHYVDHDAWFRQQVTRGLHPPPLKTFSELSNTFAMKIRPPLNALQRQSTKVLVR